MGLGSCESDRDFAKEVKVWGQGLTKEMIAAQKSFFDVRVKHANMQTLIDDLIPLLMPHSEYNVIAIVGATGTGKSTLTRVLLKSLIEEYAQLMTDDPSVIPFVAVEAYANGDRKHGFKELYAKLNSALCEPALDQKCEVKIIDGRMTVSSRRKSTVGLMREILEAALTHRKTKVVVLDESAHLKRFGEETATMDTIKSLANTSGSKWVLVGSFDLVDLLLEDGQITRRASVLLLERYLVDSKTDQAEFKFVVEKLQAKWPSKQVPNFVAISDALLEVSFGCVGLLKSILLHACAMQLRNDGIWNPQFLRKSVKSSAMLKQIRREIEEGEKKVRDAVLGNTVWTNDTFAELVRRMDGRSI